MFLFLFISKKMFCYTSAVYFDLLNEINKVDKKEYERPRNRY